MRPRWIAAVSSAASCAVICALFAALAAAPAVAQSQRPASPQAGERQPLKKNPKYKKGEKEKRGSHAKPKDAKRDAAVEGVPPPKK